MWKEVNDNKAKWVHKFAGTSSSKVVKKDIPNFWKDKLTETFKEKENSWEPNRKNENKEKSKNKQTKSITKQNKILNNKL